MLWWCEVRGERESLVAWAPIIHILYCGQAQATGPLVTSGVQSALYCTVVQPLYRCTVQGDHLVLPGTWCHLDYPGPSRPQSILWNVVFYKINQSCCWFPVSKTKHFKIYNVWSRCYVRPGWVGAFWCLAQTGLVAGVVWGLVGAEKPRIQWNIEFLITPTVRVSHSQR